MIDQLHSIAQDDPHWSGIVGDCVRLGPGQTSLHLAVFVEPYLGLLMAGQKTVESRFSQNGCAPFDEVSRGDIVLFKRTGDEIVGLARVGEVKHLMRRGDDWNNLRASYQNQLCATGDEFWSGVAHAAYASLIWFDCIKEIEPISCDKRDRRGWVVIKRASEQQLLGFA